MKFGISTVGALLAVATIAGSASAGIPSVQIRVAQEGAGSIVLSPVGVPGNAGIDYAAEVAVWGFHASFDLTSAVKADTGNQSFGGFMSLANTSSSMQRFTVEMTLETDASAGDALAGGTVTGVLAGGPLGGVFSAVGDAPVWSAIINRSSGSEVIASLLAGTASDPFSVSAGADDFANIARESFGTPIPSLPIGPLGSSRTIKMDFMLSAGAEIIIGTNFVVQVIPAPGAVAMLAIAGLGAARRRR